MALGAESQLINCYPGTYLHKRTPFPRIPAQFHSRIDCANEALITFGREVAFLIAAVGRQMRSLLAAVPGYGWVSQESPAISGLWDHRQKFPVATAFLLRTTLRSVPATRLCKEWLPCRPAFPDLLETKLLSFAHSSPMAKGGHLPTQNTGVICFSLNKTWIMKCFCQCICPGT